MTNKTAGTTSGAPRPLKFFSQYHPPTIDPPHLLAIQRESFSRFWGKGFGELLGEISPIRDYTGKEFQLEFLSYWFEPPKYSEVLARENLRTFEASMRVKSRLTNLRTREVKEQEVYVGDYPQMTSAGTFIINGVERIIVSQLIRSFGVYFTALATRSGFKRFGAKLIPLRGAWLEFLSDQVGRVFVRVDRRRRVPATLLLKCFGYGTNEEIVAALLRILGRATSIPSNLFADDPSKNREEAFLEFYRLMRPGEPLSLEVAEQFFRVLFGRPDRYNLSKVGRVEMVRRLKYASAHGTLLTKEDIAAVVADILRLNQEQGEEDDIDHLGMRRVRPVGELLEERVRVGLMRLERLVKDRMSTLDPATLTPAHLVSPRPILALVEEFFSSGELSQFMDEVNPLAGIEQKRRVSALGRGGLTRERASFEVRDVHRSHYGRICPIHTPEGPNVGLVGYLSLFSRRNELGFLETPYVRVRHGRLTQEIVWLDAFSEEQYKIAHGGTRLASRGEIIEELVEVRYQGTPAIFPKHEIELMDVSPQQSLSLASALIPFLEHDDANRAQMGANMQRQAVPLVKAEPPLVASGLEERISRDGGAVIVAQKPGIVKSVHAREIVIRYDDGEEETLTLSCFRRTNQFTALTDKPLVLAGSRVQAGDILADGGATREGMLALGQNLLVAFLSFGGLNFEDAVIISERLVRDDTLNSVHVQDFVCNVRETKLGPEETSYDIPNVSESHLKDLDEEGICRIGAEVEEGDILVGKISPKGEAELTAEERLLRAIFGEKAQEVKDTSLRLPHGRRGRVVGVKVFSREQGHKLPPGIVKSVQVEVAELRRVMVGDKLAGRHGNKGVIAKILPQEEMPFLEDGTPVDIILNPLSVTSRMNVGQILEAHLGWAAAKLGYRAISPALAGVTREEIRQELKNAGLAEDGKVVLYDGRTGSTFFDKVSVGYIYMMKLNHLVQDKIHMRSVGPYSLITQQPLGGKAQFGGQRFGEMEVWALEGYGAAHTLQEMLTIKSDDVAGRASAFDAIIRGGKISTPRVPAAFEVLVAELKSLGLIVETITRSPARMAARELVRPTESSRQAGIALRGRK